MTYKELKDRQQAEINAFPFMFAFSNEQFIKGMERLGLKPTDTDKIYSIGGGGYVRKSDYAELEAMTQRHRQEMRDAIAADTTGEGFIYDMFYYELANHEYIISGSITETLDALELTIDEINESKALLHGLKKAIDAQNEYS